MQMTTEGMLVQCLILRTLPSLSRHYKISRIALATWFQTSKAHKCTIRMKTQWWWVWLVFTIHLLNKKSHHPTQCRRRTSSSFTGVSTTTSWVGKTMIFWVSYLLSKIIAQAYQDLQSCLLRLTTAMVGMDTHISKRLQLDNSPFLRRETTSMLVPDSLIRINSSDKLASALFQITRSIWDTIRIRSSSMTITLIIHACHNLNHFHNPWIANNEGITCTTDKATATMLHPTWVSSVLKINNPLYNRVSTSTAKLSNTSNNI